MFSLQSYPAESSPSRSSTLLPLSPPYTAFPPSFPPSLCRHHTEAGRGPPPCLPHYLTRMIEPEAKFPDTIVLVFELRGCCARRPDSHTPDTTRQKAPKGLDSPLPPSRQPCISVNDPGANTVRLLPPPSQRQTDATAPCSPSPYPSPYHAFPASHSSGFV